MSFVARFIVHCQDDGTFLSVRNGQHHYTCCFAEALRFSRVDLAIDHAKSIDETLERVRVICLYEPVD